MTGTNTLLRNGGFIGATAVYGEDDGIFHRSGGFIGATAAYGENDGIFHVTDASEVVPAPDLAWVDSNADGSPSSNGWRTTTLTYSTAPKAGDIIIATIGWDTAPSSGWNPTSPPDPNGTDWNYRGRGTGSDGAYYWDKVADGTETGLSWSDQPTGNTAKSWIRTYTILEGASFKSWAVAQGSSGDPDPPAASNVASGDLVVAIGYQDDDGKYVSPSSGYTQRTAGLVSNQAVQVCTKVATSGSENPGVMSSAGSDAWNAFTAVYEQA